MPFDIELIKALYSKYPEHISTIRKVTKEEKHCPLQESYIFYCYYWCWNLH